MCAEYFIMRIYGKNDSVTNNEIEDYKWNARDHRMLEFQNSMAKGMRECSVQCTYLCWTTQVNVLAFAMESCYKYIIFHSKVHSTHLQRMGSTIKIIAYATFVRKLWKNCEGNAVQSSISFVISKWQRHRCLIWSCFK